MERPGFSATQKQELCGAVEGGRVVERYRAGAREAPGIDPRRCEDDRRDVPVARTRSMRVLSLDDREEISHGLARKDSVRGIAATLGRAPSTVSREISRHGRPGAYRPP
jgi:hypothetical protein